MSVNIPLNADINTGSFEQVKNYLNEIGRRAGMSEKEIEDMNKAIVDTGRKSKIAGDVSKRSLGGIDSAAKKVGQSLLAVFSVQLLMNFQKRIISVTAEFQKMEAVLTNTLGSNSDAKLAMSELVEFASKTPFQINELTESFIKLTNQGFRPTREEMRKLGDLASSTGKDFTQLAEAVIAAQVGEFERLKEFGIRARKEGDQVSFTFKGVTTQVEFAEKAMRGYILGLGDAVGVSGSMAAISETVGGKISNMDDNITQLAKAIGDRQSGVFAASLDWLNTFLAQATLAAQSLRELKESARNLTMAENVSNTQKEIDFLITRMGEHLTLEEKINRAVDLTIQSYKDLSDNINSNITAGKLWKQIDALEEYRVKLIATAREEQQKIDDEAKALAALEAKKRAKEAARINSLGMIAKIEFQINELNKERSQANSVQEISRIDARIKKLREELAIINMLAKPIGGLENLNPFEGIDERVKKSLDDMLKVQDDRFKKSMEKAAEWVAQNKEVVAMAADFWRDFQVQASNSVLDTYLNIEEWGAQNSQKEIERLEAEKEARLLIAGQDTDQRLLIEQEFNEKRDALRQKERGRMIRETIAQRALAVFQIIQSTLQASMAALAPPPLGLGPIAGAAVATGIKILGGLNAAAVVSQPLPAFKDGVFDLDGPGTTTSDSIHARLSRGESVVHAQGTQRFKDIIKPIIEDKNMTYDKLMGIMLEKTPMKLRGDIMKPGAAVKSVDEAYIVNGIVKGIAQVMRNKGDNTIVIDKMGVSLRNQRYARTAKNISDFLYD